MEIVVNLEPWPEDSPVSHDDTKFIILNEDKVEVASEDNVTGLVYVREIDIPVGSTYYVIAERHFSLKDSEYDISNINYKSEEFPITNNEAEISNMLLTKDIVIDTPYIFFNKNDMVNTDTNVTIRSSKFRGVGDGHTHSHWIIKSNGRIIYRSLVEKINKTSISINKDIIKNLSSFEIYCIHCSNNIESDTGVLKIVLDSLNFGLKSNVMSLVSTGTKLVINRIDITKPIGLTKVIIKHEDVILKILKTNPLLESDYEYMLSSAILEIKRDMIIELYGNDNNGELGKKTYKIDMIENLYNNDSVREDVVYKRNIESYNYEGNLPVMVSDSFRNFIFVPKDNILNIYNVAEDGILAFNKVIQSLTLGSISNENIYIKYTDNNYLIVDVKLDITHGDHPRFIIFKHDVYSDVFTLVNVIDRDDELLPVGYNNAIEFIDNEHFIYAMYGSNTLKKVNFITGTITELKEIPEVTIDSAMIIKMFDNNLLVFSNKTHKTYLYNVELNEYRDAMSIPYNQFINKNLKKVDLANGDKVLVTIEDVTSDGSIAWFDYKESTLDLLTVKLKTISDNYSIYRKNNENFIAVTKEKDYLTYLVDTVLVDKII